jgi:hypothetical protein
LTNTEIILQARTILGIPVPKVFAWSASADNSVGAEYIIMEEAPGIQLADVWDGKTIFEKKDIINSVVEIEKKMLSVSFTRFVFRVEGWYHTIGLTVD